MHESDPLGINTPLLEEITTAPLASLNYGQSERHNASVLNAETLGETATRFLGLAAAGEVQIEKVASSGFEVEPELRGYTVLIKGKVAHVVEDQTREFDGWYIGEELHGNSPYLLLSPERVSEIDHKEQPFLG